MTRAELADEIARAAVAEAGMPQSHTALSDKFFWWQMRHDSAWRRAVGLARELAARQQAPR